MNILSLFDGLSGGRVACERAGIPVTGYYASEIDKYAVQIAQKNYPDTVQLGDVKKINIDSQSIGMGYPDTFINYNDGHTRSSEHIDLLLAGFPCQGFSSAGKRQNFEDERSQLFFEAVRILKETQPRFFLFENVASMSKASQKIITQHLHGIEPVMINSALVSAQHRKRLYWVGRRKEDDTYAPLAIPQPEDRGLFLKDILEEEVDPKYIVHNEKILAFILDKQNRKRKYMLLADEQSEEKALTQTATQYASWKGTYIVQRPRGFNEGSMRDVNDSKAPTLSACDWHRNNLLYLGHMGQRRTHERVYDSEGKSTCLLSSGTNPAIHHEAVIRRLTPVECERLQTLPDGYTAGVSDNQRYKMLGNAWTVDVVAHILKSFH